MHVVSFLSDSMVSQYLELCCLTSKTVSWLLHLLRAFLPLMNQVLTCFFIVLVLIEKVSGEKCEAWQSYQVVTLWIYPGKVRDRKEVCMCVFAFLPSFPWIVCISSGLWYCFQIIGSKFIKKIIWGNFLFFFFLTISKRPGYGSNDPSICFCSQCHDLNPFS